MTEYGLVLEFDSDDPEFVRGFEAGNLLGELQATTSSIVRDRQARKSNRKMVEQIARLTGFNVHIEEIAGSDWLLVSFYRKASEAFA